MCIKDGVCRCCGCDTIELAFGQKPCDGNCYPERMNKEEWEKFKITNKLEYATN